MGTPITWRNVEVANPAAAAQPMQAATNTINGAFDIFSKLIQQRQAVDANNVQVMDEVGKQNYLDRVAQAKTPEELAALQASGALDSARQGLSAAARNNVRGAEEARLTSVRTNATAANTFDDMVRGRAEAPHLATYKTLVAAGKTAEAAAYQSANAGSVRDWSGALQTGYDTGRTRVSNKQADDLAAATNPNAIAAARFTAETRPQVEANAKGALTLAASTQTAAQQAANDAQEVRRLDIRLAREAQENSANQAVIGNMHRKVAASAGINVVNGQGLPDFANMDPAQIKLFDATAAKMGIPSSKVVTGGDTARGDVTFQRVSQSGEFSPHIVKAYEQQIRSAINSTPSGVVGNDASTLARSTAENIVGYDRSDTDSWYGPGDAGARKSLTSLSGRIGELLAENTSGFSKQDDIVHINRFLTELASTGIKTKAVDSKGKPVYVVPPAADVERFIRSSQGGWWYDDARADDIKKKLTDWLDSPEGANMAAQGAKSISFRDKQRVIQMQRELLNPQPAKK